MLRERNARAEAIPPATAAAPGGPTPPMPPRSTTPFDSARRNAGMIKVGESAKHMVDQDMVDLANRTVGEINLSGASFTQRIFYIRKRRANI